MSRSFRRRRSGSKWRIGEQRPEEQTALRILRMGAGQPHLAATTLRAVVDWTATPLALASGGSAHGLDPSYPNPRCAARRRDAGLLVGWAVLDVSAIGDGRWPLR